MRTRGKSTTEITGDCRHIKVQKVIRVFNRDLQNISLDSLNHGTHLSFLFLIFIFGRSGCWRWLGNFERINVRYTENFRMEAI